MNVNLKPQSFRIAFSKKHASFFKR